MYRPKCGADEFNGGELVLKVMISVSCVLAGDLGTSYIVYIKKFPLAEAFKALTTQKSSWASFAIINFAGFMMLAMIFTPLVGRIGQCETFDNGCTCAGVRLYQEICGCCGTAAENAASPYELCRLT